jgi:hypothetical protein
MIGDLTLAALATTGSSPNTEENREHCCTEFRGKESDRRFVAFVWDLAVLLPEVSGEAGTLRQCRAGCEWSIPPRSIVSWTAAIDASTFSSMIHRQYLLKTLAGACPKTGWQVNAGIPFPLAPQGQSMKPQSQGRGRLRPIPLGFDAELGGEHRAKSLSRRDIRQ